MNEQHELSTIIEKELLTSQRRSSNGGLYTTNEHQKAKGLVQNQQFLGQFLPQTSAFQMLGGDNVHANVEDEEEKERNKI